MQRQTSLARRVSSKAVLKFAMVLVVGLMPACATGSAPSTAQPSEQDQLISDAKREGELVLIGTSYTQFYKPVLDLFEQKYGTSVVFESADDSALRDRVFAEQAAGRYEVDVLIAAITGALAFSNQGATDPDFGSQFLLPEVLDQTKWMGGKHIFYDDRRAAFAWGASVRGFMLRNVGYNKTQVSQGDLDAIRSVWDFLDPKWIGKIAVRNLDNGYNSGYDRNYVHPDIGPVWTARLFTEMKPMFSASETLLWDGLVFGNYPWAMQGGTGILPLLQIDGISIASFNKRGTERPAISNGPAISVLKNRPHPNAAKLFVNWWLSWEGQDAYDRLAVGAEHQSMREDVTNFDRFSPYDVLQPGEPYVDFNDPDIIAKLDENTGEARLFQQAAWTEFKQFGTITAMTPDGTKVVYPRRCWPSCTDRYLDR